MRRLALFLIAICLALPAAAQAEPTVEGGEPALQHHQFRVKLALSSRGAPGMMLGTVETK